MSHHCIGLRLGLLHHLLDILGLLLGRLGLGRLGLGRLRLPHHTSGLD